jgi:glycosyltransferase involved in cell wall biosynthesis
VDKIEKESCRLQSSKVDVIMLTKNSERLLRECLASVYQNLPVNNLIIVDGYSTDATLSIIKDFQKKYGNVKIIQDRGTRGFARQKALDYVETDWFVFVDSDVVLCNDWFAKAKKLVKDDVGAIWGMEIWSVLTNSKVLGLFERVTMKIFEKRGGTHDLLVRRKAVEGICIPYHLHTYEDSYIKSWVHKKGYKVIPVYEPYCIHYRPEKVWTIEQSIEFIASDLKFAIRHPQLILSYIFYTALVIQQNFMRNFQANRLK